MKVVFELGVQYNVTINDLPNEWAEKDYETKDKWVEEWINDKLINDKLIDDYDKTWFAWHEEQ